MLISGVVAFLAALYLFSLLTGKNIGLRRNFLREGLFAFVITLILYVYGEQDRFMLNDNPQEDLADFSFILLLVVSFWTITSFVLHFFKDNLNHLNKSVFLFLRGTVLLLTIIPLDVLFNFLYLKIAYGLPLYEDYWVFEIPLKVSLILLINFLDEILLMTRPPANKATSIKIRSGGQHRFIESEAIAYFLVENQISYLYTIDGEKFMVDQPLSKLEKDFNDNNFFRASRQLLVARKAIKGYKSAPGKKIELSLADLKGDSSKYHISRLNAPDFRKWINSDSGTIQL